jgi:serine/threonine protein kinase
LQIRPNLEKYIRNESQTLKSINNLNTIRLIEHLENDVAHLFVMEYCDHGTLLDHLMKQGANPLAEKDILTIFS